MKTHACKDRTHKIQPNKMGTTPQHFHTTRPTLCAIFPCIKVVCIGGLSKAVCWVVLGVYCMLTCMESELSVAATHATAEHGRYGLFCMQKL